MAGLLTSRCYANQQGRWTGGPTVEVALPFRFALAFDALYWNNRSNNEFSIRFEPALSPYKIKVAQQSNSWDFPLLLKFRIPLRKFQPFVSAGYQFTRESIERTSISTCLGPQFSCLPSTGFPLDDPRIDFVKESRFRRGPAAGAGVEFKIRYVTITPELRFSRMSISPKDNRFTALVGFTFGGK